MKFLEEVRSVTPWLVDLRRQLHRIPEKGRQEVRTGELLCRELETLGLDVKRPWETAVVAELTGGRPGPAVAFRADMDGLPLTEQTDLDWASSHSGMMHACGHDVHMAAALGAAKLLAAHREELPGTVRFLFQPDEEMDGGAKELAEAGVMDGVRAVYGCHVAPELPVGVVGLKAGAFYAASNPFSVTVYGKSAHGAKPHEGIDAIAVACKVVTALQNICKEPGLTEPAVLSVGTFHGGSQCNILADKVTVTGIMRTFGKENRIYLTNRVEETVHGLCREVGGKAQVEIQWGFDGIVNDAEAVLQVAKAAEKLGLPVAQETCTMTTEDFGAYLAHAPGCFYHIGVGTSEPLHSSRFVPAEEALPVAAALHAQVLWDVLKK